MKFLQKAGSFLLVWVLLSASVIVSAAAPASFTVSSAKGTAGDTVSVSVSVGASSGIAACTLKLSYDAGKLQCAQAAKGTVPVDMALNPVVESGTITYSFARLTNLTVAGTVITAQFKILSAVKETIPLKLEISVCTDQNTKAIETAVVNGSVDVTGGTVSSASSSSAVSSTASTPANSGNTPSAASGAASQAVSQPGTSTSSASMQSSGSTASAAVSSSKAVSEGIPAGQSAAQPTTSVSSAEAVLSEGVESGATQSGSSSGLSDANGGIVVSSLPEGILLNVVKMDPNSDLFGLYSDKLEGEEIAELYSIILMENSNVYAPPAPLTVSMAYPEGYREDANYRVAIFQEDGTVAYAEPTLTQEGISFPYEKGSFFALVTDKSRFPILPALAVAGIVVIAAAVILILKFRKK